MMSPLLLAFKVTLTPRIHRIISALREAISALSIVRNDGTVHGTRIVGSNAADHDPVSSR